MVFLLKNIEKESIILSEIINSVKSSDLYFTENNKRTVVKDISSLKKLIKESHSVYYQNEQDKKGIVMVWKSFGGDKARCYVKLLADNAQTAKDLLTILLWNYEKDLFAKVKRSSIFFPVFIDKGFEFQAGRGLEILLITNKKIREKIRRTKQNAQ